MHAVQGALKIFLAMIHPGVALEYRERAFRTTACGTGRRGSSFYHGDAGWRYHMHRTLRGCA